MRSGATASVYANPRTIARVLLVISGVLIFAHLLGQYTRIHLGRTHALGLIDLFDLNREGNLPTLYASMLLLLCAGLLAVIGAIKLRMRDAFSRHWVGLACVFVFLSVDEGAGLHERLTDPFRTTLDESGLLYQAAWIIPYLALLGSFLVLYFRFALHLPRRTMIRFVLAGAIFVGGSIGGELLGALHHVLVGKQLDMAYALLIALEEGLEMGGMVVFVFALVSYLGTETERLEILFQPGRESGRALSREAAGTFPTPDSEPGSSFHEPVRPSS
jgi:hypothetical protein